MACDNCSEELITTSQGPQGDPGATGATGAAGANGFLDWSDYDISCLESNGIFTVGDTNPERDQKFIDSYCEVFQKVNTCPVALDDYIVINQDTNGHVIPQSNDNYLLPTTVLSISQAPVNGTATINDDEKTITYIPNEGFVGNDVFEYTLTDGECSSTASIFITINAVISQQTIQDTVLEQLTILLQSDEYWDLGFNIGDKIGISNINLVDFDFTNPFTAGIGKAGRYSKWAICNGNNGTEDLTDGTFRGFNHTNSDYDESAKAGGSDSVALVRANIPAHQHKYFDTFINAIDNSDPALSSYVDTHAAALGVTQGTINVPGPEISEGPSADREGVWYDRNTSDGTDNLGDQKEVANGTGTVTAVNIRNAFKTVILIQKIS